MKQSDDPNQTLFNWSSPTAPAVTPKASFPDPVKLAAEAPPPLVERLPWDFAATFPQPTEEALEAGRLCEEDCTPQNVKSIHDEHARELLTILYGLDAVMDARRCGVDPATSKPPRTHASCERLRRLYETEPPRLERAFNNLLEVYEETFGPEAAHAFNRFIKATHALIPVEIDQPPARLPQSPSPNPPIAVSSRPRAKQLSHPGSSRLPVPRPLREAIQAAHFGIDEQAKPITPTPDEVRAITEQHAEKIVTLLDGRRQMERSLTAPHCGDSARVGSEASRLQRQVEVELAKYADSFGKEAAEQLGRYVQRQLHGR